MLDTLLALARSYLARSAQKAALSSPPLLETLVATSPTQRVRRFCERGALNLLPLAALVGILGGAVAAILDAASQSLHRLGYGLAFGETISNAAALQPQRIFLMLIGGGFLVGLSSWAWVRFVKTDIVDAVEANALFGGRMSLRASLFLAAQTVASNGAGASVGLEGGFTQAATAIGSKVGRLARLKREDLRRLVTCGAAGAIAGAFDAPLTGTAYAFELILGAYVPEILAPILIAAICGKFAARAISGPSQHIVLNPALASAPPPWWFAPVLGIVAGLLAIVLMRGVTIFEFLFVRLRTPAPLSVALGGLGIGLVALLSPQVLGAGQDSLQLTMMRHATGWAMLFVFGLKLFSCAFSLGSGFRGGLFATSLFMGDLLGAGIGAILVDYGAARPGSIDVAALIGMCALTSAVIGSPLALALLVIEATGRVIYIVDALIAIVAATTTVRVLFGYSFSTWQLHLHGSPARNALDIGWTNAIQVRDFMSSEAHQIDASATVSEALSRFSPALTRRVVLENGGHYAGICDIAELMIAQAPSQTKLASFARLKEVFLTPDDTMQHALELFEKDEADALAVVASRGDLTVCGVVVEAHLLQRYVQECGRQGRV